MLNITFKKYLPKKSKEIKSCNVRIIARKIKRRFDLPHEEEKSGDKCRIFVKETYRSNLCIPAKVSSQTACERHVRIWQGKSGWSQNGGNGPHPEESLPSAGDEAAAMFCLRISRFPAGELSRSRDGRSCLPHMMLPPSPTAPIGFIETKLEVLLSRMGLRKWGKEWTVVVVARDSTRDSMIVLRDRKRERGVANVLLVARVSSYGGERTVFCGSQMSSRAVNCLLELLSSVTITCIGGPR